jgi:tetratricopeptide (TPR) repeat protein
MAKSELEGGPLVASILQVTPQLLAQNEMDKAKENYWTAMRLLQDWYQELLSDDPSVSNRAKNKQLPEGADVATFATAPIQGLYRILSAQGELDQAMNTAQIALRLYQKLAPTSAGAADCLDEVGTLATSLGDAEYSKRLFNGAAQIREYIAISANERRA